MPSIKRAGFERPFTCRFILGTHLRSMRETGGMHDMRRDLDETGISTFNWEVKSRKTVFLEIPRSTDEIASIECRGTLKSKSNKPHQDSSMSQSPIIANEVH